MPSTPSLRPSTSYFCSQPAPVSLKRWAPAFASPTSRTSQTKGKVESGVKYVRRNMWPSMRFTDDDADLNRQGLEWSGVAANARVHGTTYRIPWEMLDEELAYFGKLPDRADADTAQMMDRVVEVVRSSHPEECGSGWRPVAVDPGPWGTCFGAPGERGYLVGGVPAPPGLMEGGSARWASGRDSSNNVLVYWSEDSRERPSGGAGCWLFDSSSRSWSANRGLAGASFFALPRLGVWEPPASGP